MTLCNICKKNPAVIFSSKVDENGKRQMEGLCINCAKKQGINTDEILNAQAKSSINPQEMNKQIEGLMKNLTESLGSIEGIELGAIPVSDNFDEDIDSDDDSNENPQKIFAGAIPLGSIFGDFNTIFNNKW